MFWKADSTLDASSADVSMNDNPFSAKTNERHLLRRILDPRVKTIKKRTCKNLRFLRWYSAQVFQIALVTNQHNDNVGIGMVAQLLQPSCDVYVRCMLCNVVHKQCANGTSIISEINGIIVSVLKGPHTSLTSHPH